MNVKRWFLGIGVVALGVTAASAASAHAAGAKPAFTCAGGAVCVFKDAGLAGGNYVWFQGDADSNFNAASPIKFSDGVKVNDNISSILNNSGRTAVFCTDAGYRGHCVSYPAQTVTPQVQYNDAYSSMKFN
jgi:hypothetical protein